MTRRLFGRREITTDASEVTEANVVKVIEQAYITHLINRDEIEYLYKYYKGDQPILYRVKEVRPEITNYIVENRANLIVTFLSGYMVGKPIQYVSSISDADVSESIAKLNDLMRVAGKGAKDKQLLDWALIAGTSYRMVLPSKKKRLPFDLFTLDPRSTFVVRRNDIGRTPVCSACYTVSEKQEVTFDVYTNEMYFKISGGKILESQKLAIPMMPIIEYPLNMARLGAFEVVLPLLDALNNLDSNNLDSVEQTVQSLLVATNCNFADGTTANTIRQAGMVVLKSFGEYKAEIKVIGETLDQSQTQVQKQALLDAIYEIAGIPSQGHANTGDSSNNGAVILKNGWQSTETKAQDFEMMFTEPEQRTVELVLEICRSLSDLNLDADSVMPKFTRRNYEDILSKSQTLVTMLGQDKIHPQCAYEACGLFVDTQDAYNMGMEWYEEHKAEAAEIQKQFQPNEEEDDDSPV